MIPAESVSAPQGAVPQGFGLDHHLAALEEVGFTVIADFLTVAQLDDFQRGLAPWLGAYRGRNDFEGRRTERVYTLVGRGRIFEDVASEPRLMALLDVLLEPHYLLSADHAICVHPGERAQALHFDDSFYAIPRPRPPVSISVIGAISPFTPANGGTVLYPGSHKWSLAKCQEVSRVVAQGGTPDATVVNLAMPAGAICVFLGTLLHGAGANVTDKPRISYTNQYCQPWARPQENFFLGVPRDAVAGMAPEVRALLGYELRRPGDIMGQVSGYHPARALDRDWIAPVRRPAPLADHRPFEEV